MKRGFFGALARDAFDDNGDSVFLGGGFWSSPSATGITINQASALQCTTVMACASILCEDTSKMTPGLYRRVPKLGYANGSRVRLTPKEHPIAALLRQPNPWMTWPEFCQMMVLGFVLRGNGYAVILRDNRGQPTMLVPINPDRVALWQSPNGMLFWQVTRAGLHEIAVLKDQPWLIPYENVLHLKGLSQNGLLGLSRIAMNREAVAVALAQEQQYAKLMGNGARPSGVLTTQQKLTPDMAARIRNDWNTINAGLVNAGKTAILEAGLKWEPLTLSAVDMQFLQLRQFQLQEICRMFRVPPHMVGDLTRGTFSNIVQQAQDYRNNTLTTYSEMWEKRLDFTFDLDGDDLFVDFDETALLKADLTARYNAHRISILTGWEKRNEVRIKEGQEVLEEAEELLTPTNMMDADMVGVDPNDPNAAGGKPGSDQTGKPDDGNAPGKGKVGIDNQENPESGNA